MALTLPQVVASFKADVGKALSAHRIRQTCANLQITFRDRLFNPVVTFHVFLTQILHGNVAILALPHLAGFAFAAAAYCEARKRLHLIFFQDLLERVIDGLDASRRSARLWQDRHRIWFLDGSSFSMPDTPVLQKHFGQPGAQAKGCGFPVAHILGLFDAQTGFLQRVLASPLRTHDMAHAAYMHPEMEAGDVLVADRGFASFAHLALLLSRNLHGLFRCHQRQIVDFTPGRKHTGRRKPTKGKPRSRWLKRLGKGDQLVAYPKPKRKPTWISEEAYARLPEEVIVRELRFNVHSPGRRVREITLSTTLTDPVLYPFHVLADLYEQRWQVELNFRHLKTTMKMEVLHCKTVEGVLKELTMYALVYNLVRLAMLEASKKQRVPLARISFIDALRWLRSATPGTPMPELVLNPDRPNRIEPRAVKRRPKEYDRLNKPREELRKSLTNQGNAA